MSAVIEFSVIPVGAGESISPYVAECVKIVEASGVKYQLTPMGTILEGDLDHLMAIILKCHKKVMDMTHRVNTIIKIDDRKERENALEGKIRSVREKL